MSTSGRTVARWVVPVAVGVVVLGVSVAGGLAAETVASDWDTADGQAGVGSAGEWNDSTDLSEHTNPDTVARHTAALPTGRVPAQRA